MRICLSLALIALAIPALPVEVGAESPAIANATADLNMRSGPGTGHPVLLTIPRGGRVNVNGCTAGFDWCDVTFSGSKGWAAGQYLVYGGNGRYQGQPISAAGPELGVPRYGQDRPVYKGGPVYKGDPVAAAPPPVQAHDYDVELYPFAREPCPRYPDRYFEHQVC